MKRCDDIDLFYDDELPPERRDAFLEHLAECSSCQAALADRTQLTVAVARWGTAPPAEAAAARPGPAGPTVLAARRRRWLGAGGVLAAAAALALVLRDPDVEDPDRPVDHVEALDDLQLPPTRGFEPRLSLLAADRHRPLEVARSAATGAASEVSLTTLGRLEQAGDRRGLASAYILNGQLAQAEAVLPRDGDVADVDSDLAAIRLAAGRLDEALALVDAVLALRPGHRQARWNRGLILRALGLPFAAATELEVVAAAGEPGWSDEARALAAALRRDPLQRRRIFVDVQAAGLALIRDGTPLPDPLIDGAPGMARLYFYDALRAAPTRERLLALRPLAARLDALAGGEILIGMIDRSAAAFARRSSFAATYEALATGSPPVAAAELDAYLQGLGRTDFADLRLGALIHGGRAAADLAVLGGLADRTGDPWFIAYAAQERGQAAMDRGDYATGEAILVDALAACHAARVDYRCARIEYALADLYVREGRLPEAEARIDAALGRVQTDVQWGLENSLLHLRASVARLRSALPRARACFAEARARVPEDEPARCEAEKFIATSLADLALFDGRHEAARELLTGMRGCDEPPTWLELYVWVELAWHSRSDADLQRVLGGLSRRAALPTTPADAAVAAYLEGKARLHGERERGRALLRRAIALAEPLGRGDPNALKARSFSHGALALDAADDGPAAALQVLAGEIGVAAPERCVLGLAVDYERALVVGRDAAGAPLLRSTPLGDGLARLSVGGLVPADIVASLRGCEQVDVLARPPIAGLPQVLPNDIAWSYRVGQAHLRRRPDGPAAAPGRLVVADVKPPAHLGLAALAPWQDIAADPGEPLTLLTGSQATPERLLLVLPRASTIEIHAHGLVNLGISDASLIALSPDARGRFALTAADIRGVELPARPLVILGACHAGQVASYLHEPWSLAMAFIEAGASAVVASPEPVPDRSSDRFFAAARRRVHDGEPVAVAVQRERAALGPAAAAWADKVLVFR